MPWVENDNGDLSLDPPLELIDTDALTLHQMQAACLAMGVDPDAVFRGGVAEIPDIPPLECVDVLFGPDGIVENGDAYDPMQWPVGRLRSVLAAIVQHFATACRLPSGAPMPNSGHGASTSRRLGTTTTPAPETAGA